MKTILIDNRGIRYESVGATDADTRETFDTFQLAGRFVRIELWDGGTMIDARDVVP